MKITIIVPVYNGEKFLPEFLSCLMRQTIKDFEVFFIDDSSTDRTGELLQKAVEKNSRFHYLRNENRKGAAISRNRGIDCSESEYVLCLDADDLVADDLLDQLIQAADLHNADMVMLERGDFSKSDKVKRENFFLKDDKILYRKRVFRISGQPNDFFLRCQNGTCDRMIKRELLDKYYIRFQNLPCSNDVFYTLFSTFVAERIAHTQTFDFLYYRRVHSEKGRISNSRDPMCAFKALLAIKDALEQHGIWEECCVYFWIFTLDSLEKQLFVCKDEERQRQVYKYLQEDGLKLLGVPEDPFFQKLTDGYKKQFERLHTLAYEEKCFNDSMTFHALCDDNSKKIIEIFEYAERKNLLVGYWGIGRMTEGFLLVAKDAGKKVDFLIDNSKEKQGKWMHDSEVFSYERVANHVGLVIISNKQYYLEIAKQVKEVNGSTVVLSIQEYLQSGLELEECLR
ncbi:MAG: glycosyltransferase [Ruminococcus flavefaciens]|nr:glycosyltransferase [Ruminococcus flavefaciens]